MSETGLTTTGGAVSTMRFDLATVKEQMAYQDKFIALRDNYISEHLVPDMHYGIVPGCKKPSLLKPGAEMLFDLFKMREGAAHIDAKEDTDNMDFHYRVQLEIVHIASGNIAGIGFGACSSRENKYWAKIDGTRLNTSANTILKMAIKRAATDACLKILALSGRFTQDMEDIADNTNGAKTTAPKATTPAGTAPTTAANTAGVDLSVLDGIPTGGKYEGIPYSKIPREYVEWMRDNVKDDDWKEKNLAKWNGILAAQNATRPVREPKKKDPDPLAKGHKETTPVKPTEENAHDLPMGDANATPPADEVPGIAGAIDSAMTAFDRLVNEKKIGGKMVFDWKKQVGLGYEWPKPTQADYDKVVKLLELANEYLPI